MAKRKRKNRRKSKGEVAPSAEAGLSDEPPPDEPPPDPHRAGTVLIIGIASLFVCPLLGPVAWSLGQGDLDDMKLGTMDPAGWTVTRVGTVCGMIGTGMLFLFLAVGVFAAIMFIVFGRDPFGPLPNG